AGLDARGARYRNAQWDDSVLFHQNVLDYERPLYARPDLAFILRNQDLRAAVLEVLKTDPRYFSRMMGHPLLYSQQRRDMVGVIRDLSFGPELRDLPGETVKMLRSMVEPFTGDPATRSALEQFDRILANKDEGAIGEVQRFLPQDTHSPVTAPSFLERLKGFLSDRFGRTDSPKPANLIEVDFSKKRPKP
ncbi:MAG: hypothetical protein ACXWPM_11905, partial [Bdellovibrionota bacterium]